MKKYVTPLLLLATMLTSCTQEDKKDVVIESVTVTSTNTHTVTPTPTTTSPNPVVEEQETNNQQQEEQEISVQQQEEYPIVDEQAVMEEEIPQLPFNYSEEDYMRDKDKVVSHCGIRGIEEIGTTWFTDGTTGWTQYCTDEMMNQIPQTIPPGHSGEPAPIPYEDPSQMYNQHGEPVSDWVQDQIRFNACINAGNTNQYCATH